MSKPPSSEPRIRWAPLLVAASLSVGNLYLHMPISNVCDAFFAQVGRRWYEIVSLGGIGLLCVAASVPAARRLGAALAATWLPAALLGLTLLTAAAQRWLLVTNIELIHFPQFALISVLFLAAGVGPRTAWVLGSLAGLLDETYQHLVIYADRPDTYFDINDILLNAIGAAWGVCLFGAARLAASGRNFAVSSTYAAAILACAAAIAAAVIVDPPDRVFLRPAMTHKLYRVLSVGEGFAGIFAAAWLIELAALPRSRGERIDPRSQPGPA